jgi:hypothetical protein
MEIDSVAHLLVAEPRIRGGADLDELQDLEHQRTWSVITMRFAGRAAINRPLIASAEIRSFPGSCLCFRLRRRFTFWM